MEQTSLRRRDQLIEFGHQTGLAPCRVVLVDDTLARDTVEHAEGIADRRRRDVGVAGSNGGFGFFDVGAGGGAIRAVPHALLLIHPDPLLRGLIVRQGDSPLDAFDILLNTRRRLLGRNPEMVPDGSLPLNRRRLG